MAKMKPREMLRKYYPVGSKFEIGVFEDFKLLPVTGDRAKHSKVIDTDIIMEAKDVGSEKYRWLVFTDSDGKEYGSSVESMIELHNKEIIEITMVSKPT